MQTFLYAAVGPRLTAYAVDAGAATLSERGGVVLPAGVQYAWRHAVQPLVYFACSDGGPGRAGSTHFAVAMRLAPDGSLCPHGAPLPLRSRPVHLATDRESRYLLIAYNEPSALTVHRIGEDGQIGAEVPQAPVSFGKTLHQVMVTPDNRRVIVPVRGTDASATRAEDPGSIEVFAWRDGQLVHRQSIAPEGGFGFGPRHVDFHPTQPWMYCSIERQNELAFFDIAGEVEGPRWRSSTLQRPQDVKPRQLVGAVHVHPNGHYVYVSNRADGTIESAGEKVFNGGENSIAVFAIDPASGEPRRIQVEDARGMHPRTFHVDPTGRMLVAAPKSAGRVREGEWVREVPAGLSVFRIGGDGRLAFAAKHELGTAQADLFWAGMFRV